MKKALLFVLGAVLLAGCEKIEGQLNVAQDVKLKNSKGVTKTIKPGAYTADIKANTKKKITLRLNDDRNEKYEFNIPAQSLPSNGTFKYTANTLGQPVDMQGEVKTTVSESGRKTAYETCSYSSPEQVCYPMPQGGVQCSIRYVERFGTRYVTYFDRSTFRNVALTILSPNTTTEVADFLGDINWNERVVLSQTMCR